MAERSRRCHLVGHVVEDFFPLRALDRDVTLSRLHFLVGFGSFPAIDSVLFLLRACFRRALMATFVTLDECLRRF